jgi:hypothetical protein
MSVYKFTLYFPYLWQCVSGGQLAREDSNGSISLELCGSGDKTDGSSHVPKIKVGVGNTVLAEMKARQEKRTSSPRQVYIAFVKNKTIPPQSLYTNVGT